MGSLTVSDLAVGDKVTAFFAVRKANIREYTKGKFVSLELGHASGRLPAVIWDPDAFALNELEAGMVVKVRGSITEYQDRKQLTVVRLRLARDGEYDLTEILPQSPIPIEERRGRITRLAEQIQNSYIRSLIDSFINDEDFFQRWLTSAAGKLWHHAYIGGLADHSANVAELAVRVAQGYEFLNRDYIIFGGLLHDVGKINTYAADASIDYTDEGRLVGHICIADTWLVERAGAIETFPPALLMKLRHLLLSHQGEYETPVRPMMPEAFVLYYCDEIDSKMGAIERIRNKQGEPGWSPWVNLLDRYLYFDSIKDRPSDD